MNKAWIVDNEPSRRYPIYTRGNVGEVFPDPVAPLSWTLYGSPLVEPAWREGFERFGAFDRSEFSGDEIEIVGVFGGYCYINASISRIFGVRTPGLTPELIDAMLFGEQPGVRPYEPQPGDESPEHTARVEVTLQRILTIDRIGELEDDRDDVERLRAERPDLASLSDQQLVDRVRDILPARFHRIFVHNIYVSYGSFVGLGVLDAISRQLDEPDLALRLVSGLGAVDSAEPSFALWELGRIVAQSPELMTAFDGGVDGLHDRLRTCGSPDAARFLAGFTGFCDEFGSRGPNEWELRSPTWETHPELALAAVDRMRLSADVSPRDRQEEQATEREALIASVAKRLDGTPGVRDQFLAGVRSAAVFLAGRERCKTTMVKLIHEARLTLRELGRRMVEADVFQLPEDFGMLTAGELDAFVRDPASFDAIVRQRAQHYAELGEREPPFVIDTVVPCFDAWPRRGDRRVTAGAALTLRGLPGSPGRASGPARVLHSPADACRLNPGEVLVAPITDPAWTPLFLAAAAVVVDVGAMVSHAVIIARELGIPCVVSVADATRRIPDGAMVTVDGGAGAVIIH